MDQDDSGPSGERLISTFPCIRALAMLTQAGWETLIFKTKVIEGVPRMNELFYNASMANRTILQSVIYEDHDSGSELKLPTLTEDMHSQYVGAAVMFSLFYIFGVLSAFAFWASYVLRKRGSKPVFPFIATLIFIVCNMPALVCDMYMLKSQGVISWKEDLYDIILHLLYCTNGFAHVFMDLFRTNLDKTKDGFGTVITTAVSFLFMNALYTPVMWTLVGWYWIGIYEVTTLKDVVFVGLARESFNTLVLLGHFGQFVSFSLLVLMLVCLVSIRMDKKEPGDEKVDPWAAAAAKSESRRLGDIVQQQSLGRIEEELGHKTKPETDPLLTAKPETDPLQTTKPETDSLLTAKPVTDPLLATKPVTDPLMTTKPETDPMLAPNPVTDPLLATNPVTDPLLTAKPVTDTLLATKPDTDPLLTAKPVTDPLQTARSVTDTRSAKMEIFKGYYSIA